MDERHGVRTIRRNDRPEEFLRLGARVFIVDREAHDKKSFIAAVAEALPMDPPLHPESNNWDAFLDSLSGGLTEVDGQWIVVIWTHAQKLKKSDASSFRIAKTCLQAAVDRCQRQDPEFRRDVLFLLG